jgi:signal transduction histidine kinase
VVYGSTSFDDGGAGAAAVKTVDDKLTAAVKKDLPPDELAIIERKEAFAKQVQIDLRDQTLGSLVRRGTLALGGVAVAGVWLGWLAAGRTLRPLKQITGTARRVADRSLHERIALGGPRDELRELADTFDDMLERLDRSFDGQRRFVANASHELRTPLAINRTLLEVAMGQPDAPPQLRQLGTTLLEVNARHERLIDGLLTMARSEQAVVDPVPVDLADVAGNVLDQTRAPGVEMRHELLPAPTSGDPVLLERLTQNLVDNAVRYNATGGWVQVTCTHEGASTRLSVTNTGPVVRAYEVPGLFEPFRRLSDRVGSARGTGLGLSIVRSVARAHGGEVQATPRDGGGLVVQVTLPAN